MKKILASLAVALVTALTITASADPQKTTYVETSGQNGQNVEFKDDLMTAPGLDRGGAVITIRPSAVRMLLLRPRTQFVTEMLKSVENL